MFVCLFPHCMLAKISFSCLLCLLLLLLLLFFFFFFFLAPSHRLIGCYWGGGGGGYSDGGTVDDGNTQMDYLREERERGITIVSAATTFQVGRHSVNPDLPF